MNRVLIVDDEYHIREGIKHTIPWSAMDLELVDTAANGRQAWEKLEQLPVDIVLLDINMPDMDGLELAARIREHKLDIEIIYLTGYDDFPKIKKALELQAVDYLLKPVAYGDLHQALTQALSSVREKRSSREYVLSLKEKVQESSEVQAENVLLGFMQQHKGLNDTRLQLEKWGIVLQFDQSYAVISAEIDHYSKASEHWTLHDRQLYLYAFRKLAQEVLEPYSGSLTVREHPGKITILASIGYGPEDRHATAALLELSGKLQKTYLEYLNLSVSIGVSQLRSDPTQIHQSYLEAHQALEYRSVLGTKMIIHYPLVHPYPSESTGMPGKELLLLNELRAGNEKTVMDALEAIFEDLRQRPISELRIVASQLLVFTRRLIAQAGIEEQDFAIGDPLTRIRLAQTAEEVIGTLNSLFRQAVCSIQQKKIKDNASPKVIEEAKKWIREHLGEEITLERIGRELHLSPNYLSALFKKTTGESFIEFTTRIRFEHAKQLLLDPDIKVYEVAERIGYTDANYFSIAFKKSEGLTPSQFRSRYI